jgi:hypothetical protein
MKTRRVPNAYMIYQSSSPESIIIGLIIRYVLLNVTEQIIVPKPNYLYSTIYTN